MKKLVLCVVLLQLFFLTASTALGQAYTATKLDIPYLDGGGSGMWVNASGQVAGSFSTRHKGTVTCCHAFLWSKSAGMIDLGSLGGGGSSAYALNDSGEVTGWSATGEPGAVTGVDVFVWTQAGGMQDLSLSSACCFGQAGLNNNGQIAGTYNLTGGQHAFLWSQSTGVKDLGTLGGNSSFANAINNNGQVVGVSATGGSPNHEFAFLWTEAAGMEPFLDSTFDSSAFGINDSGEIVGTFSTDGVHTDVFFWNQTSGMQDLGPAGSSGSPAINARGQVVGMRQTSDLNEVPFVWSQPAGMRDLSTLVRENIKPTYVGSINNAGQIVAWNFSSAFLLTPKMSVTINSSMNPSLVGQNVTITATMSSIAGPPPDGENVTFTSGTTVLAVVPMINGVAAFSTSTLKAGFHSILARYAGDSTYASCRSAFLKQAITK
jgi:probable HAF family extracellular repeat protein